MRVPWPAARMTIDKLISPLSKHKKMTKATPCDKTGNHASVITDTVVGGKHVIRLVRRLIFYHFIFFCCKTKGRSGCAMHDLVSIHRPKRAALLRGEEGVNWGGRIRTSESRLQRPLPYHLATPHRKAMAASPIFYHIPQISATEVGLQTVGFLGAAFIHHLPSARWL